jgi:riboflavin kinase/FMN adenylyltransferase
MKSLRLEQLRRGDLGPVVLTIGNFDGVHRGHQFIISRLRARADTAGLPAVALTFDPHPIKLLNPQKGLQLIMPFTERTRLLERYGVEILLTAAFTHEMARTPAEEWVRRTPVELLQVQELLIGYDFSFGRGRDGNAEHLKVLGQKFGFVVQQLTPISEDGWPISSSRIRRLVAAGEVDTARKLLGRPFHLRGAVGHGDHRGGSVLGIPTANLQTEWELLPHVGVYAGVAVAGDRLYPAAINVGKNPTFDLNELRVEAHLLDFTGDLYGTELELHFVRRLRDEKKYHAVEHLLVEMHRDIAKTRALFANLPREQWLR